MTMMRLKPMDDGCESTYADPGVGATSVNDQVKGLSADLAVAREKESGLININKGQKEM